MQKIFFLSLLLLSLPGFSQSIGVDWSCPSGSSGRSVDVSFDDQGKFKLSPDVFRGSIGAGGAQASKCITDFQQRVNDRLTEYQSSRCTDSKEFLCIATVSYVNDKLVEHLKASSAVKSLGISISPLGSSSSSSSNSSPPVQTPQEHLKELIKKKVIDPAKLSHTFTYQKKNYRVSDFDEVVGANIKDVFKKMSTSEAKQYAQNYMLAKTDVLKNETPSAKRTAVLNNLNKMFGYLYGERGKEELAKMLECSPEDELTPIENILNTLEKSTEVSKCAPLDPGEHKVFDHSSYYTSGDYLLKRDKNGNYQVALNVRFTQSGGSVTPEKMLERSKGCLALASEAMKGPNGERIQLNVLSPEEVQKLPEDQRPALRQVKIEGPAYNTDAASYNENVDCRTITHEMLHLLGLCDEYKETRPQYAKYNWTCRVVTKAPSIMRDLNTFDQAVPKTLTCGCTDKMCTSIMNSKNENLKKIYTGMDGFEILEFDFRKNCTPSNVFNYETDNLKEPGKAAYLLHDSGNEFVVESRAFGKKNEAPYYFLSTTTLTCKCKTGDAECMRERKRIIKKIQTGRRTAMCPRQTTEIKAEQGTKGRHMSLAGSALTLVTEPEIPSLIQPSHFNKILSGNCPGKADNYRKCAEWAYKGSPCDVPPECNDDSYYLGSPQ